MSAGAAGVSSVVAGVSAGASVVAGVSAGASLPLLPQDATKRPRVRASTLTFTNFMTLFFLDGYACLSRFEKKVTLAFWIFLKIYLIN
ncbi:hypothetical protein [Nemorincola caseinilytica]|uniref:hypothetical protein n=1 Tax=Nemorincola caseinilytica TaxID=2054315 RepID=UPI0031EDDF1C